MMEIMLLKTPLTPLISKPKFFVNVLTKKRFNKTNIVIEKKLDNEFIMVFFVRITLFPLQILSNLHFYQQYFYIDLYFHIFHLDQV